MARVVHFEIHADDLERAKTFYSAVFDWPFEDYSTMTGSPYLGITTGAEGDPGINGGLMPRPDGDTAPRSGAGAFVCTIQVDDYDATEQRILAAGGEVAQAKASLGGMAWQGYYRDTEGNVFGIHQTDPDAGS